MWHIEEVGVIKLFECVKKVKDVLYFQEVSHQ